MRITDNGLQLDSWDDILAERVQGLRNIYGQDIDLSQNTPDGQRVGLEARQISDAQQVAAFIYNEMDPDLASLIGLRRLGKLNSIFQRPVTASQWDIKVTTDRAVTIRENFAIQDDLGQVWITAGRELPPGETTITFKSQLVGAIGGGTTVERDTVVLGIVGLSPVGAPLLGRDEESPDQFRIRRRRTVAIAAQSVKGALYSGLAATDGVTDLQVYDNEQKTTDPETGLEGNSVYVVVEGGTVADIVRMIAIHKGMGTMSLGDITGQWVEELNGPNNRPFSFLHEMRFDRPEYVDLHVKLTATRFAVDEPVDTELIKERLAAVEPLIGQSIQAGEMYKYAYIDTARYVITDLEISRDGITYTDAELAPLINEKFQFDKSRIVINEVTP